MCVSVAIHVYMQSSYRKAVTAARRDKKNGKQQGLTEEQKQEIRCVQGVLLVAILSTLTLSYIDTCHRNAGVSVICTKPEHPSPIAVCMKCEVLGFPQNDSVVS